MAENMDLSEGRRQKILAELKLYEGKEVPQYIENADGDRVESETYKFARECAEKMSEKLHTQISFSEIVSDPGQGDNADANGLGRIRISHQFAEKHENLAELRETFQHELWHPQQIDDKLNAISAYMYPINFLSGLIDFLPTSVGLYDLKNGLNTNLLKLQLPDQKIYECEADFAAGGDITISNFGSIKRKPLSYSDDTTDSDHPNDKQRLAMSLRLKKMEEVTGLNFHPRDVNINSVCSFSLKGTNKEIATRMASRELEYRHSDYSNDPQKYRKEFQELENRNLKGLNNITPEIMVQIDIQVNSTIRELDRIIDSSTKAANTKLNTEYNGKYDFTDDTVPRF